MMSPKDLLFQLTYERRRAHSMKQRQVKIEAIRRLLAQYPELMEMAHC